MIKKTALITGVLGGIGKALGKTFRERGYFVYGLDIRTPDAGEAAQVCDVFIPFDLHGYCTNESYRTQHQREFSKLIPTLSVLVNNAAVQLLDHTESIRLEDWQETLNVNLTGPMLLSQYFIPLLEQEKGVIVNIASIHQQLTKPRFVSYATSKSALVGLTKAMAVDLKDRVRVNAISPAAIETTMLRAGFNNDEAALDILRNLHPVKRIGYPDEVAQLVLFLCSEEAGFISGANFTLDGGISSVLHDL
ncbi:MAG: SDR family oxidoreductase [Saprospiraceae bacterium]|nr:SDR family oxidoreductase [Saprospiraceae bacterium]